MLEEWTDLPEKVGLKAYVVHENAADFDTILIKNRFRSNKQ